MSSTFFVNGSLSERRYGVARPETIRIPTSDGTVLVGSIVRPETTGRLPLLLGCHPYPNNEQFEAVEPVAFSNRLAHVEAGDSNYFARRGYVHVVINIRGTGESGGQFGNLDARTILDIREAIEWLAQQPYCNGKVGMFGMSYFAIVQQHVAALPPPALKAIFAPYAWTDMYRDRYYRGGILVHGFMRLWLPSLHKVRIGSPVRKAIGDQAYQQRIDQALDDPEIAAVPYLVEALRHWQSGANELIADTVIQPFDNAYYRQRSSGGSSNGHSGPRVPAYLGADWGIYGLHLPGAFRTWEAAQAQAGTQAEAQAPARLTIGPPLYLDRPIFQYHEEALRWFDHWLKDRDTGMMAEKPVQLFIEGSGHWRAADQWPLPETRFTSFYLHPGGVLSEHEPWVAGASESFVDGPGERGGLWFWTPRLVEVTEICGPIVLNLHARSSDSEVLWFVSLYLDDPAEGQRLLTRGWLRGSQRALDLDKSRRWQPVHSHLAREPLQPDEDYLFNIQIRPYALLLKPGQRLGLAIRCCDDEKPATLLQAIGSGCVARPQRSTITVQLSPDTPSHLILPVISGNRIGTFWSGGMPAELDAPIASRH